MNISYRTIASWIFVPITIFSTSGFQVSEQEPVAVPSTTVSSATDPTANLPSVIVPTSDAATANVLPSSVPAPSVTSTPATPKFDMNEAAARYVALVKEADRISTLNPMSADAIASSLRLTSRVSGRGVTEGAGAYIALTAASHAEFASSLATVVNLLGRDAVLVRLKENPQALFSLINGYGSASKLASGALHSSVATLTQAQNVLGEAAYGVQKQPWAQRVVDTPATLAMVRSEAAAPTGLGELTEWTLAPRISDEPIHPRFLIAASYRLLGDDVAATEILDKPLGRMCMNRVQLNVRQCIAASQYPYEHLFCLSRHSFGESMSCVKDAVK